MASKALDRMLHIMQGLGLYIPVRVTSTAQSGRTTPPCASRRCGIAGLLFLLGTNLLHLTLIANTVFVVIKLPSKSLDEILFLAWTFSPLLSVIIVKSLTFINHLSLRSLVDQLKVMNTIIAGRRNSFPKYWKYKEIVFISILIIICYNELLKDVYYIIFDKDSLGSFAVYFKMEMTINICYAIINSTFLAVICSFNLFVKIIVAYLLDSSSMLEEKRVAQSRKSHVDSSNGIFPARISVLSGPEEPDVSTVTLVSAANDHTQASARHRCRTTNKELLLQFEQDLFRSEKCLDTIMETYSYILLVISINFLSNLIFGLYTLIVALNQKQISAVEIPVSIVTQSMAQLLLLHDPADELANAVSTADRTIDYRQN